MDLIALTGKSNTGKSTFFSAATLVDVEISNRIFTTVKANVGIGYVTTQCPCKRLGVECNPQNSKCENGVRLVPIKMIDVAGLVKGAHKGRGLGNQFLSDIMEAKALMHIVDISGGTDQDGNPIKPGTNDPLEDIKSFAQEIDFWILGILTKNWDQIRKKIETTKTGLDVLITKQLAGLGITEEFVKESIKRVNLDVNADEKKLLEFVEVLRERNKPILIAANKIDVPVSREIFERVKKSGLDCIPCSAESELALRRAARGDIIKYVSGESKFEIKNEEKLNEQQKKALDFIQENVLNKYGSTGVQQILNKAIFDLLNYIVVYPVANINRLSDKKNNILPDAILVPKGTTLKEFAEKIHTDLAEKFIGGIEHETRRKIGADYELKNREIVEILFGK